MAEQNTKADPNEEQEAAGDANLTPTGKRTLEGYVKRWGEEQGEQKFMQACRSGTLDAGKMYRNPKGDMAVGVSKK